MREVGEALLVERAELERERRSLTESHKGEDEDVDCTKFLRRRPKIHINFRSNQRHREPRMLPIFFNGAKANPTVP